MYLTKLSVLIMVVLELLRFKVDGQTACSCYRFEEGRPSRMAWQQAKASCEANKEHLVVMETVREWEFINKEIRNRTADKYNEWHIGLFRNLTTGNWTWINGKPLTIDRWQPHNPDDNDLFALIAKDYPSGFYGLFSTMNDNVKRGWICEEETDNCQGVCMYHNPVPTTITSPRSTTATTQRTISITQGHTNHLSDSSAIPTTPGEGEQKSDKNDPTLVIVAASLAAVLIIVLMVLAVVFFRRRKKRRGKDAERPGQKSSKETENQYEAIDPVEAAQLLGTPDTNSVRPATKQESLKVECEYAMVNKANKKKKKGELVYAELDGTKHDAETHKPAMYEPTVYADIMPSDVPHETSPDSAQPTYENLQSTQSTGV